MKIDLIQQIAAMVNKPISYTAVWDDRYYDTKSIMETHGFTDPQTAFERSKDYAEHTGFSGVDYWVAAEFGDVLIRRVDGFEGRT